MFFGASILLVSVQHMTDSHCSLSFQYILCCVIVVAKLSGSSNWLKITNIPPQVCM